MVELSTNPFADVNANFSLGNNALLSLPILSMNNARRMGWTDFFDICVSLVKLAQHLYHPFYVPHPSGFL